MRLPSYAEVDLRGRKVLLRVDFNVPVEGGKVTNDFRLRMTIPTLTELRHRGAGLIIISHLGRPKGKREPKLSLAPVANALSGLLERRVMFVDDIVGSKAKMAAAALKEGEIMVLENLRFDPREEKNDADFAKALASLAAVYVNDAFGTLHRAHASVEAITRFIPSYAGPLVLKETDVLLRLSTSPAHPFVVLLGGAKVEDKINLVEKFIERADKVLIGGAMAYTFLKAQGIPIGRSRYDPKSIESVSRALKSSKQNGDKLFLPVDHIVVKSIEGDEVPQVSEGMIPEGYIGVDIGPRTIERYRVAMRGAKTILWNGPMGVFEVERFSKGTMAMARAIGRSRAYTVLCGGDTISAVELYGNIDRLSYVSTGGGAALEFLENPQLPGIKALLRQKEF
jgi:phosphoglycerate kinase